MTITQQNYLSLENLFVNELFGNIIVFTIFALLAVNYYSVKNRLPTEAIIALNFLVISASMSIALNSFVWMIILFVISIVIYSLLARIFNR